MNSLLQPSHPGLAALRTRAWALLLPLALLILSTMVAGCATIRNDGSTGRAPGDKLDPWEKWNRKVFAFNEGFDQHLLKPVATVYHDVVPQPVRKTVDRFFNNAADGWSAVNHLLQGKWKSGFEMTVRFTTNTFLGFGGLLDIATEAGIESQPEDLGQTFGHYGFNSGPYIVWPIIGSSTVRDSIALPFDLQATPAVVINDGAAQVEITVLQVVNKRSNLLSASDMLDDIALDKYSFVRDAYLTRRRSLVFDGSPPEDADDDPYVREPTATQSVAPDAPAKPASAASAVW